MKLTRIEMFKDLSNMEQAKLLGMLTKLELPAGTLLFEQGDPGDRMFIVERGTIELFLNTEAGGRRSLALLGQWEVLGEMALLTGEVRSAGAQAAVETTLRGQL
ncbi:cyclic nucleotide-binding domain-containing protein [Paenibacillus sp. FSL K6-0276]|uniref:cyclic nucleotide-binding domain-containing protein n=1 Tax=Paenibacillus sp. FSL K6-0276 TaxID=2921450 RepID=UPI0030EBB230